MKRLSLLLSGTLAALTMYGAEPDNFFNILTSPEITDGDVTFRIYAPHATSVAVKGQFMDGTLPMEKNPSGIWSLTLPLPEPDIYPYNFIINDVDVSDPGNPNTFPNETFKASLLEIPGTETLYTVREVPHGKVHYGTYDSDELGVTRNIIVYTPAEYDANPIKQYPVLYLISGTTDTEETWFKVGRANTILDNLIATGEAIPMIIVMPYGNMGETPQPSSPEAALMYEAFSRELTGNIIPYVETYYRTLTGPENNAIAGFSRGGGQAMYCAFKYPELFGWLGSFSAYLTPATLDFFFPNAAETADAMKLLWMSVGTSDFLYPDVTRNKNYFDEKGIKATYIERPKQYHTWMHARYCLAEFLKSLFMQPTAAAK